MGELLSILSSVTLGLLLNISLAYFWMQGKALPMPRSVFVLSWMILILLIGASRLSWRIFRDNHLHRVSIKDGKAVLIIGAGDAGATVARELHNSNNGEKRIPIGFVDDDRKKIGMQMLGLKVLGSRREIPKLVEDYNIKEIIIAIPSAPGRVIREIVEVCRKTSASLKILPGIYELINGKVSISQIRKVQVEDILGREPVVIDLESIAVYLTDKTVLVTGAGGSIGSELCRQIAQFQPGLLILLGHGENSIYHIHKELADTYLDLEVAPVIADVRDKVAMSNIFKKYSPQVVFHAAAHKHVPLMEYNPLEAVKNNILGTYCVASAADRYHSDIFVLISTDKAVNPTSIMGATKRVAEMIIQKIGRQSSTRFVAVRFGNVLGSRGSVVPLFRGQIARGGPLTVTHPDMTRYFMTIPEAVQLVIQAGALARGGEVFVLDMGEPVKILDLARSMIQLSGFEPGEDIEIIFTGIRPGEKLYEELLTDTEGVNSTKHNRIFAAKVDRPDENRLEAFLKVIGDSGWTSSENDVIKALKGVVPEFKINNGMALDGGDRDMVALIG
jgi:FlaA1/EpsC-like NDP-sugar epimerase